MSRETGELTSWWMERITVSVHYCGQEFQYQIWKHVSLLMALFDKNRALALKKAMAGQFENLGGTMLALDGPGGSTLVSERNKKALSVLRRELDAGKRKVAIFYGAGHMPDMAKRLEKDFGLVPTTTRWLVAWDMDEANAGNRVRSDGKPGER